MFVTVFANFSPAWIELFGFNSQLSNSICICWLYAVLVQNSQTVSCYFLVRCVQPFFDGFGKIFFWSITLSCFNASVMTSTWSGPERFIELTLSGISFAKRYFFALFYVLMCECWFEVPLLMSYQEFLNLQNMRKCM